MPNVGNSWRGIDTSIRDERYYKDLVFWNNSEIIQFKGAIQDLEWDPSKLGSTKGRCDNYPMEKANISLAGCGTCGGATCPT